MTPKCSLIELKRTLFLVNMHILTHNCDSRELPSVLKKKKIPFRVSLVLHVNNISIRVAPLGYTCMMDIPRLDSRPISPCMMNLHPVLQQHPYFK